MREDFFSARMKKLRKRNGITQSEMANVLHVSRSCVSNYEKGQRQPDMDVIRRIARYFHVSTDYLLGRPEELLKEQNITLDLSVLDMEGKLQFLHFYYYLCQQTV